MLLRNSGMILLGGAALVLGLAIATPSLADEEGMKQKQAQGETSLKPGDRGEPGINDGGQAIPPGEGEQTGRPGTIGAPATLPPDETAPGYEGADQQQQKKTQGSEPNQ